MSNRDDTEVEISSSEFVMCKINRCLITSYLMTSELESSMIFLSCFSNSHYKESASKRIIFFF